MFRQSSSFSSSLQWYSVSGERSEVLRNTSLSLEGGEREGEERGKEGERERDMEREVSLPRRPNAEFLRDRHCTYSSVQHHSKNTCKIFNIILNKW